MKKWKKGLALALSVMLIGTTVDVSVFAAGETGTVICDQHTEHDDICGYVEAVDACEGEDTAQSYDVVTNGTFTDTSGNEWSWTLDDDGTLTITGSGEMPDFTFAAGSGVNSPWYDSCEEITSVVVTGNVLSVGDYAFYSCTNLTFVTLPDTVTSIGEWAFYACSSLASITLPDTVTSIGGRAFHSCSQLELTALPSSLTSIGCTHFVIAAI